MTFSTAEDYLAELEKRAVLPQGFRTATTDMSFFPVERPVPKPLPMRLNLLVLEEATAAFAGVFTRNAFPGAPVLLGRSVIDEPYSRGVVINNKIANVGGPRALADAKLIQADTAVLFGAPVGEFFVASTGIIGWSLPVNDMRRTLPVLPGLLQNVSALPLAKGIMTTDAWPKVRSRQLFGGRITALAKGAGMIEPNMATMLVYICTDIELSRKALRDMLPRVVAKTFNAISIDSDQSTSDMALMWSSQRVQCADALVFEKALEDLCRELAQDIVRNGEGTSHVIEVRVTGAATPEQARLAGKAVVNSALVKTAIFGNDPNVGRVLASVGDAFGNAGLILDPAALGLKIAGETVFARGAFQLDKVKEERLSRAFLAAALPEKKAGFPPHEENVVLELHLGQGNAETVVWGSDLSYEYVRENADYRS